MEDMEEKDVGQKSAQQLAKELLEVLNKQLETHTQLKETVESLVTALARGKEVVSNEEMVDKVKDLFIDAEALQAEERAIFHQLFPSED